MTFASDRQHSKSFGTEGSGHQRKIWVKENNIDYLIKFDSKFRESEKEYSASVILQAAKVPCVIYIKGKYFYKGQLRNCCKCKSFLNEGDNSITLASLVADVNISSQESALSYFNKVVNAVEYQLGIEHDNIAKYILSTLTVDYLFMNSDRHLSNFEFVYREGVWRPAPLFDFGQSFLHTNGMLSKADYIRLERRLKTRPFSTVPEKNLIDISYAKSFCRYMLNNIGSVDALEINSSHKQMFKNRCNRLLNLN